MSEKAGKHERGILVKNTDEYIDLSVSRFSIFKMKIANSRAITIFGDNPKVDINNCYLNVLSLKIMVSSILPEADPRFMILDISYKSDDEAILLSQVAWKASYNGVILVPTNLAIMISRGKVHSPFIAKMRSPDDSVIRGIKVKITLTWDISSSRPQSARMGSYIKNVYTPTKALENEVTPLIAWFIGRDEVKHQIIFNKEYTVKGSKSISPLTELVTGASSQVGTVLNMNADKIMTIMEKDFVQRVAKLVGNGMSVSNDDKEQLKALYDRTTSSSLSTFLIRATTELGM